MDGENCMMPNTPWDDDYFFEKERFENVFMWLGIKCQVYDAEFTGKKKANVCFTVAKEIDPIKWEVLVRRFKLEINPPSQ
jgi:hypothetical protein